MRNILLLLSSFLVTLNPLFKTMNYENNASSYIVLNQNNNEILEGKKINEQQSVASISKIMTAILAIESNDLFTTTIVGDEIDNVIGSSLYLEKNTYVTIIEMVYGLLMRSGNDASIIIAKTVSNSVENFVELMNSKAKEIGMVDTYFSNPNGLDIYDEGNISTSYDMALLMSYCMNNTLFREIVSTKRYNSYCKGWWKNKHKLLHTYKYCTGGKTGYTKKAKRTLITSASKDNMNLIIVTLNCGNDFDMHEYLFEKYFNNFININILQEGENKILEYIIVSKRKYSIIIEKEKLEGGTLLYCVYPASLKIEVYIVKNNVQRLVFEDNIVEFKYS
ncbi:MAG: D-alanyl-D-alanine carboxypeptidase family protein [Bacilli bacterium]